jgi:hypothetical protein
MADGSRGYMVQSTETGLAKKQNICAVGVQALEAAFTGAHAPVRFENE